MILIREEYITNYSKRNKKNTLDFKYLGAEYLNKSSLLLIFDDDRCKSDSEYQNQIMYKIPPLLKMHNTNPAHRLLDSL